MKSLGIDIGTTSICCVVYDSVTGSSESVTESRDVQISSMNPWEKAQDVSMISEVITGLAEKMFAKYPEIGEIGLTGQMHGILYVDKNGKPVSPLYTWQDQRGNLKYDGGVTYAEHLSALTGYRMATGYGLTTHFYNLRNGLVPAGAVRICTVMDYAALLLTGETSPVSDPSNAASLGLFDRRSLKFDDAALAAAGISPDILPTVVRSGTVVGKYRGKVPVIAAIGDNQASYLGSVADPEKTIHITVGTSSQISVFTREYVEAPGVDTRPLPSGGYIMVGAPLCGGVTMAILNFFFRDVVEKCTGVKISKEQAYDAFSSTGYKPCSDEDIEVNTLFSGSRLDPTQRGSLTNVSSDNLTADGVVRGFLRGMSHELQDFYDCFPESVRKGRSVIAGSGNGIRKNELLRKIIEESFGYPMRISDCAEEAAKGACITAMVGSGRIPDFKSFWK